MRKNLQSLPLPAQWYRYLLTLLTTCCLSSWTVAMAGMYPVDKGEIPTLKSSEGLLAVAVDTSTPLEAAYMRKADGLSSSKVLKDMPGGRSFALLRVPAGRYGWHSLRIGDWSRSWAWLEIDLADKAELYFDVKPGIINYGGDLVVRPVGHGRADIYDADRSLPVMDWLESEHPELYKKFVFAYSGNYADPFPAYYQAIRKDSNDKKVSATEWIAPPDPGKLKLDPGVLWQQYRVTSVSLSPDGRLLAMQVKEEGKNNWAIDMIDLQAGESQRVSRTDLPFEDVSWSGSENLLLSLKADDLRRDRTNQNASDDFVTVVRVDRHGAERIKYDAYSLPRNGRVLDLLADDPDHILFATLGVYGDFFVHRLDISSKQAVSRFRPEIEKPLNRPGKDEYWWYADGTGRLRIALSYVEGGIVFSQPAEDGKLVEFLRLGADSTMSIFALSRDGKTLYALTDEDREQRELVEFDIASRRVTRTLFSKPGVDIVSPIFDNRGEVVGARYYESGQRVGDFFKQQDRQLDETLRKAFPGRSVSVIDQSEDGLQLILKVESSDVTPKIYHLDRSQAKAALLEDGMPWLASIKLAPSEVITARSKDGLSIESYLTIPPGTDKRPLIVMPHGGPIGVSDTLRFNPDAQFLASLGYAVLRVNYRGSDGFGKTFREAGHGKFGTDIEDDIDAALSAALAKYPLDPKRMCVLGFSYGGYSALIAAARWPDRFRCVVSIMGVSDRILFFNASDGTRTAKGRLLAEKLLGNPHTQAEEMIATSPVYRAGDIIAPVMLAHGLDDQRVDYEHTARMRRMLELEGRPPVGMVFEHEGHGLESLENTDTLWTGIAGFLKQYLDDDEKSKASPAASD